MVGPIATEIHVVLPYYHGPTMFLMATVRHKRWDPCLLYRTSLKWCDVGGPRTKKILDECGLSLKMSHVMVKSI